MSCRNINNTPNPVKVCQEVYGQENINDVRDCILDSIRRFYGTMCDFHENNLYYIIQSYLVQILKDAGRNPKAVKLPFSPPRLEPNFFLTNYINSGFNKEQAYQMCLQQSGNSINCYIDKHSI